MTLHYTRPIPVDASMQVYEATAAHIRHHLSAIASDTDDPREYAAEVHIDRRERADGLVELVGTLDREPHADYLTDGYDPYDGVPDELRAEGNR